MKKGAYIILCVVIFIFGISTGKIKEYLDNDWRNHPAGRINAEDFFGTKKYHTVKLGEFKSEGVDDNTVYQFS